MKNWLLLLFLLYVPLAAAGQEPGPSGGGGPLSAAVVNTHGATLTWTAGADNGDAVASFYIYRSSDGVHFVKVGSVAVLVTTFVDAPLAAGQTYQYYVTAVDASENQSAPSNTITATVPTP